MKDNETAFMAQVALGIFTIKKSGDILRNARFVAGSKFKTPTTLKRLASPRRAETSESAGYLKIMFTHANHRYSIKAHRAVWMFFNQTPIPGGLQINHKNGDRKDNRPENLEVMTSRENTIHAGSILKTLGKKDQLGGKNTGAKLTPDQVIQIRLMWKDRVMSQPALAKMFGVAQQTIANICARKTWKHLPE